MRAVFPGKPQAELQTLSCGKWRRKFICAYISGTALIVLDSPNHVLQTIYHQDGVILSSVQLEEASGRISTSSGSSVLVYSPVESGSHITVYVNYTLEYHLRLEDPNDTVTSLCWGSTGELLIGSSFLTLYAVTETSSAIWRKALSNPVKIAEFSYDGALIASVSHFSRLVKVWRRLSFGVADLQFDFGYLPHPATVDGLYWKKPWSRDQVITKVLYTTCEDYIIRIWAVMDPHGLQMLQNWGEIDMLGSVCPRAVPPQKRSNRRFAFVIDERNFATAMEVAVQQAGNNHQEQQALAHLIDVAHRNPEVIVILDDQGHMSAWGLDNPGSRNRKVGDIFNVAHVDRLDLGLLSSLAGNGSVARFYSFCFDDSPGGFNILVHQFHGAITWFQGRLDQIFDPSPQSKRLRLLATWTGHSSAIEKVNRTASGKALLSRSKDNECIVWREADQPSGPVMSLRSVIPGQEQFILRICLLRDGEFAVFLHNSFLSLWDTRNSKATELSRVDYSIKGQPLCLILVPGADSQSNLAHVFTISSEMESIAWEINFSLAPALHDGVTAKSSSAHWLREYARSRIDKTIDIAYIVSVDPAGTAPVINGFLDTFARDVLIAYGRTGVLSTWTVRVNYKSSKLDWLLTSSFETGLRSPSLVSGTSIRKAALVNETRRLLTIWDTRNCILEYEEHFDENDCIQDLDWISTPDNQSVLAVGFSHTVMIYAQMRFDYLNYGASWRCIREISLLRFTDHPIGDSVWLRAGNVVIGVGNQLFVEDTMVNTWESTADLQLSSQGGPQHNLFHLVRFLNGSLPVFHPQFLAQCLLAGKLILVQRIIVQLLRVLKFFSPGDTVDSLLSISISDFMETPTGAPRTAVRNLTISYADFADSEEPTTVTEEVAFAINDILARVSIPQLSSHDQLRLANIIECVSVMEKHRQSIDVNGSRFLIFFRESATKAARSIHGPSSVSWREIVWAFHSNCQEILVDLVSTHYNGKMSWIHARECGLFMWTKDYNTLRTQFEAVARNEYNRNGERNPVDCSLYYIALKKKAVLVGLWRMASWHREQGATRQLLSNNFQEQRWKTAALKNAYALLGRRRFEYAAAFFLLGDQLRDAVNVLANQLGDVQLAIAVARVYEGVDGPVLRDFLQETLLPQAAREGNRWLATWAFWMLSQRDKAVRALITPLHTLITPPISPSLQSQSYLADDPARVVLYKQLREKTLLTLRGAAMIHPRDEWEFILRSARLYGRMGCDILALDLVHSWDFLAPNSDKTNSLNIHDMCSTSNANLDFPKSSPVRSGFDPRRMLRRRSSLVVVDLPLPVTAQDSSSSSYAVEGGSATEDVTAGHTVQPKESEMPSEAEKKVLPTFQEPSPNALLDAFGF